jgi:hypothetical protein
MKESGFVRMRKASIAIKKTIDTAMRRTFFIEWRTFTEYSDIKNSFAT